MVNIKEILEARGYDWKYVPERREEIEHEIDETVKGIHRSLSYISWDRSFFD